MRKRLLSMILVLSMMITILPAQALAALPENSADHPFSDVPQGSWYEDAVEYVYKNGLFSGTSDTTFHPESGMSRGMYVTVIGRQVGVDASAYAGKSTFSDVAADAWYAPYVTWAAEKGIVYGTGDGKFSPDALIDRQQMAVLTVRLYDIMGYSLPEPTVTTTPKDIDRIADYAKEAALRLWACGLFAGDTAGNFLPGQTTTRAQAAVFLTRIDNHLIASGVKAPAEKPQEEKPSKPSGGGSGGTSTTYYEVQFAFVDGQDDAGISLPETKTYASGTKITELPTPYQRNGIFLGWYYDAAGTLGTESGDTVTKNMTLYADFADEVTPLDERDTPSYFTRRDVGTGFTFQVQAESEQAVRDALTLICVTNGNKEIADYTLSGEGGVYTVSADLEPGQTYKAQLAENSGAVFYENGAMPSSIRTLNFIAKMNETLNLKLADGLIYLPVEDVSDMTGTALDGLISLSVADGSGAAQSNTSGGSFSYRGNEKIAVGDTVAIYEGKRPDERKVATDDAVAYVTVIEISGSTYTYTAADPENVLFTPDVLPVPKDADTDGNTEDHSITVPVSTFAYTDSTFTQAGLDETTTPDIGDFIAFYTGAVGARDASAPEYGEIATVETSSNEQGEFYIITYTPVEESVVLDSMDIYSERTENIELSQSQIAQVEADIERQAIESGFVDEAANYLMALAEETDGFQELSESARVRITARTADGTPVPLSALAWEGNDWEWGADDKKVEAHITKDLDHFEDSNGLRAELKLTFSAEKDLGNGNKIGIELEAVFEQEILLSINVSGGAIWKWAWIFPYIYDYRLNANIDVGTYTGIAITAVAKTSNEEEEEGVDWAELGVDVKAGEKLVNIGEKIVDLMKEEDSFLGQVVGGESGDSGDEEEGSGNPLVDKYAEMMQEADESWIELVRKEIFSIEGSVDPFHILVYGFGADFVVSANLYITLGMTFEYGNAKRYNFSLLLFHQQTTSETIDLEEAHYEFVFYVMGTIGVRAGVELEVAVGLLSLKLDSIGITAEVGAYAQLWGYFYYRVAWSQSEGKDSFYSGAMFVEVGIYLEIKFKAQLFSSEKLTYNPTLYENKWPLWSAGQAENVYDFAYSQEEAPEFVWYKVYTIAVPDDAFTMTYMDLTSGETDTKAFDDTNFIITCTNPAFTYDVDTNLLTVAPAEGNVQETGELNLIWKGGPLSFTSRSINRVISVEWTDPVGGHYIKFETNGGSNINMLYKKEGVALTQPAAPTKQGYDFAGWYEDDGTFQTAYAFPSAMPDYDKTVYAKWDPATDTRYTVRHYQQNLSDSGYTLFESEPMSGTTESQTYAAAKSYTGFTAQPITQKTIRPDGSAVVEIYYDRNEYTATFTYGAQAVKGDENTAPVTYTKKFGSTIYAPKLKLGGYIFDGFDGWTAGDNGSILTGNAAYTATWTPDPNTPYRVEHYLQRVGGSGYLLNAENGVEYKSGPTGSDIVLDSIKHTPEGFSFEPSEQPVAEPKIGADGKTVVKLYYARNSHTVTWDTDGGTEIPQSTCLYNAILYAPAQPSKTGYTFGGWFYDVGTWEQPFNGGADTMGMEDITITAKWIPGAGTAYKLERYTQDLDGLSYTLAETENLIGETDSTVNADSSKTITGFTFDENNASNVLTGTVAADGGFTLKVYYARNTYPVTWKGWNDTEFAVTEEKYGDAITPPETNPTRTGYDFAGWEGLTDTTTMTAEPMTFTAAWAAKGDTPYTVEHYTEELDGTYSASPAQTEQKYGATAAQIEAQSIVITGFTCDKAIAGTVASGIIAADGTLVLKLYYTRNEYTVTWMGYNGAEFKKDTLKFEQTISKPTTNPTRTGYSFTGWGNVAATMPAQDTTYTAGWSADKYTVTFNANGGTVTPASKEVAFNQTYGDLPTPVLAEHVFQGWYTEDDADVDDGATAGTQVTSGTTVAITANQTLYAHWQKGDPVKYTVNHYQQNITDDEYTLKENEEREGVVNGMTTAAEKNYGAGFTAQSFEQKAITGSGVVVDIYYTRNSFTLTWNPNGGAMTGGAANGSYKYETPITAPTVIRAGYTGGWPADVSATMPAKDTTYTANWTANEYDVNFDTNGGGTAPTSQTVTFGQAYGTLPTVTRTGYTFDGWFTAAEGGTKVTDTTSVSTAANHTLYAHWTLVEYTITYNLNGGNGVSNGTYTIESAAVTLQTPTRAGYTFDGWYDNAGLTGTAVTTIPAGSTGSKAFWAKWTGNTVTVTLNNDGEMSGIVVTLGGTYAGLTDPEPKDGRTFQGWYTELGGKGTKVTSTTTVTTAAAHTLYAYWEPNQYTVTLTLNGGVLPDGSEFAETPSGAWEKAYTFGYGFTLPVPEQSGKIFGGWYTDNSFTGTPVTAIGDTDFGNKSYTAKWESATYTIAFELNDGAFDEGQENPLTYSVTDGEFTLPVPTKDGFTLVGWYDNPECKGLPIETITAENAGNYTLYARWWQGDETTIKYINTDDDLKQLNRKTLTDLLIILNTDVTLTSWNGITSITNCEIDGRGHTVTLSGSVNSQGLINTLNSGYVHDLTVTGSIKYNPLSYKYFGGIAGQMTGGVIENCSVKDLTFDPPLKSLDREIGGLVGKMDGGEIRFTSDFQSDMSVTIVAEPNNKSWGAYGGLVGQCFGKVVNEGQVTMNVTLGAGSISAENSNSGSYIYLGGLFGRVRLSESMALQNFTINGTLTHAYDGQTGDYTYYVGGLVGMAYRTSSSSDATLTVGPNCVNGVSIVAKNKDLNTGEDRRSSGRLYGVGENLVVDESGVLLDKDGTPITQAASAMPMLPVSLEEPEAGGHLPPNPDLILEPNLDPIPEPVPGPVPEPETEPQPEP